MPIIKNWPLLADAVVQIILHPETWNQSYYAAKTDCGTAFCVAGWVTRLAGAEPVFEGDHWATTDCILNGRQRYIDAASSELLGLDLVRGDSLYDGDNSLETILKLVTNWAEVDGYELPALITDKYAELVA
ncbi:MULTISPECIES: hypothetical protein [Nocardia]|uniref:hypothetical protein n=1 Tax=Nocardia TaxID=1817 RepID=UPI0007A4F44A|nr:MULTISPECIES: hypothetical protein [Nocardia]